eukprot:TRINITY_DN6493_c0_g2_i1.p1 TRINITY_DN6493_c0_g2~~TRINITY_DN6493_c0_g2_i1.p1  ORF type:complete len:415 (-),score=32.87 TRINITY_DN6493_c0_g2_i1:417-1661(-)
MLVTSQSLSCKVNQIRRQIKRSCKGPDVEADPRYRRFDMSEVHAWECRMEFCKELSLGLGRINLAKCSCWIAAEDDSIVSHSTVKFPVQSFMDRIDNLATDVYRQVFEPVDTSNWSASDILIRMENYLFKTRGFQVSEFGRTGLTPMSIVDHPGVWEDPSAAYLPECLIRRRCLSATLAILYSGVVRSLLVSKLLPFGAIINVLDPSLPPVGRPFEVLDTRSLIDADGYVLNACSLDVVKEQLTHLKRSFWPFSWECGDAEQADQWLCFGGFKGAAEAYFRTAQSAEHAIITQTAANRQARGVWTSTGGGDLRRAVAACERLVLLDENDVLHRRDLAVLYLHQGEIFKAKAEIRAVLDSPVVVQQMAKAEQDLLFQVQYVLKEIKQQDRALTLTGQLRSERPTIDLNRKLPLTW